MNFHQLIRFDTDAIIDFWLPIGAGISWLAILGLIVVAIDELLVKPRRRYLHQQRIKDIVNGR